MTGQRMLDGVVLAIGFSIGVACTDSSAQTSAARREVVADDTVGVVRLLAIVRGTDPLVCEMTTRTADMHGSWSNWGPLSGDPLVMDSASAALLNWIQHTHKDPALVAPLQSALRDDDRCVRRVASSLLSRVHHPSAVTALLSALGDAKPGTREVAAFGLGMTETLGAIDPLLERLHDATPAVRRAAAWSLGQLEAKKAVPGLVELLAHDSDARVRQTAAWAIGSIH